MGIIANCDELTLSQSSGRHNVVAFAWTAVRAVYEAHNNA